MQLPIDIDFQNMDASEAVATRVKDRIAKLEHLFDRTISCRVTIEAPHRHHHKGNLYHVRILLRVPGEDIIVSRDPGNAHAHEDVYVAVRDAFDAAERQLQDFVRRRRGDVKAHAAPLQGRILRLFRDEGYGFAATTDGQEIYFHRNSVVNGRFEELREGEPVRLVVAEGESPQGPQATTVERIGELQLRPS